jgi:hypothetical protein
MNTLKQRCKSRLASALRHLAKRVRALQEWTEYVLCPSLEDWIYAGFGRPTLRFYYFLNEAAHQLDPPPPPVITYDSDVPF